MGVCNEIDKGYFCGKKIEFNAGSKAFWYKKKHTLLSKLKDFIQLLFTDKNSLKAKV